MALETARYKLLSKCQHLKC